MTKEEKYDLIGNLAICLYLKNIKISFDSLNAILKDNNAAYDGNRGLASGVSAAWRYWKKKDPVIYHAIQYVFTDKDGNLAWEKYE